MGGFDGIHLLLDDGQETQRQKDGEGKKKKRALASDFAKTIVYYSATG
jgi:hypothetical protein